MNGIRVCITNEKRARARARVCMCVCVCAFNIHFDVRSNISYIGQRRLPILRLDQRIRAVFLAEYLALFGERIDTCGIQDRKHANDFSTSLSSLFVKAILNREDKAKARTEKHRSGKYNFYTRLYPLRATECKKVGMER